MTDGEFDGWYKEAALTNKVFFPYDVYAVGSNGQLWKNGEPQELEGQPGRLYSVVVK